MQFKNYLKYSNLNDINELLQWVIDKLSITSGEVIIVSNDNVLNNYSTPDLQLHAILHPAAIKGVYNLILSSSKPNDLDLILVHELIHVYQCEKGWLTINLEGKEFTWKGKKYEAKFPYFNRPWEKEAFKMQYKLLREWRKYKRNLKKKK